MARVRGSGGKFGWMFLLFWSAITLIFDGVIGTTIYYQYRAAGFPVIDGTVVASKVESSTDSDGDTTYRAEISFRYRVGAETYTSDSYRYGSFSSSSHSLARSAVDRYPVGKDVVVHYNPSDPSDAVLEAGVSGFELFMGLFMMPFNMVMVGGWGLLLFSGRSPDEENTIGGYELVKDDLETRLKLRNASPLLAACITAGALAFVAIFPIAFLLDANPSVAFMALVWVGILTAAALAFVLSALPRFSGANDIVIDHVRGVVRFPKGWLGGVEVADDAVRDVDIRVSDSGTKVNGKSARVLFVAYDDLAGQRQELPVAYRFEEPERLDDVAYWLMETFKIQPTETPDSASDTETNEPQSPDDDMDMTMGV